MCTHKKSKYFKNQWKNQIFAQFKKLDSTIRGFRCLKNAVNITTIHKITKNRQSYNETACSFGEFILSLVTFPKVT